MIRCTHPNSSDRLCRSHIMYYRCGYCMLEYLWGYYEGTLPLLWHAYQACITLKYPHSTPKGIQTCNSHISTYRLLTAYLLLRVNLDKIMHACWDFDASSARTRRVSALDKHQNWSASALFCLNSRAQSTYAVVNLIHTRYKQAFFVFHYVIIRHFSTF